YHLPAGRPDTAGPPSGGNGQGRFQAGSSGASFLCDDGQLADRPSVLVAEPLRVGPIATRDRALRLEIEEVGERAENAGDFSPAILAVERFGVTVDDDFNF